MHNYDLIKDYKNNHQYRTSFNNIAMRTFGIDFETWYKKGFWNENYLCYSYVDNGKVICNISVNDMDVIINGKDKKAIQIATVMTDKDYRKKGLAASLMKIIFEKYEKDYDMFYLSANENVVDFYPKFGFKLEEETRFTLPVDMSTTTKANLRKLDISNKEDLEVILHLKSRSKPISKTLGIKNDQHILMFYCLNGFGEYIYYSDDEDIAVIYTVEEGILHLYDVISCEDVCLHRILDKILFPGIEKVVFHFTPDLKDDRLVCESDFTNYRFVRTSSVKLPKRFVFPQISQT